MENQQYIERNPEIMMGKPVIKGTRITVELIVRKLANGYTVRDLLKSCSHLSEKQVSAALEYTAEMLANEETIETA